MTVLNEEKLKLVKDNVHAGDINLQRVRIAINDAGIHAHPTVMRDHLLCGIAHLQSAADHLEEALRDEPGT